MIKMNTLLAKCEHSASRFHSFCQTLVQCFKTKSYIYRGEQKTYTPREGYAEDASKMGTTKVVRTVSEDFQLLIPNMKEYLREVFSIEATNSAGAQRVALKVGDVVFGNLTALDLMRLKSLLTSDNFVSVIGAIPTHSSAEVWQECTSEVYKGREIFETALNKGVSKTTETEEVILKDPNIDPNHIPSNYQAKTTLKKKVVEIGDYTFQKFTGEWSERRKEQLIERRDQLLQAIIVALKEINDVEPKAPDLNVDALVDYIYQVN